MNAEPRIDGVEREITSFRAEVRTEFATVRAELRAEMREMRDELRAEIREGDAETRNFMRILHEDLVSRLSVIGEAIEVLRSDVDDLKRRR